VEKNLLDDICGWVGGAKLQKQHLLDSLYWPGDSTVLGEGFRSLIASLLV